MHALTPTRMPTADQATKPVVSPAPSTRPDTARSVHSADLFKGQASVLIEHNGASYRLQITKLGKLILTK
jgi:hemin uptake protein HemP